jgi:hypothetical protein
MRKIYVKVNADFYEDGKVLPNWFEWEDGRKYSVDRILDIRSAASTRVGGIGLRYLIRVLGKETYIWLEDEANKWFMEAK